MSKKMDYFNESIKFDPVNHYLVLSPNELIDLKKNCSKEIIQQLEDKLSLYMYSYKERQINVTTKPKDLEGISKRDYVSLATYYWPNPDTDDGLPYISRDGESNPEGDNYDKQKLRTLAYMTYYQALLYYLTEDKRYHDLLVENCSYFFLDKEVGMNPNMDHAQLIMGVNLGRGIGIIDYAGNFSYALVMLKNLEHFNMLDGSFNKELKKWLNDFLYWLTHSKIALEEKYSGNNHGTFYDFLLIVLYDYLDRTDEIVPLTYQMIEERISKQISQNGELPKETARTKSISYSLMGLKGMLDFATIAKKHQIDLWNINSWYYKKIDVSLEAAIRYLYHYLVYKREPWPYKQITIYDEATILPLIYIAHKALDMKVDLTSFICKEKIVDDVILLLFVILNR